MTEKNENTEDATETAEQEPGFIVAVKAFYEDEAEAQMVAFLLEQLINNQLSAIDAKNRVTFTVLNV